MAKAVARNGHDYTRMVGPICLVILAFIQGSRAQRVKVDAEVVSYPGQPVNLRCAFSDATGIQLTQVSWIYEPKDGERMNIAVFHPNFGANYPASPVKGRVAFTTNPPTLQSPSIQITDVKMTDEGKYICEFATYPSGNEQGITSLIMLAKPQNSASVVTVVAGAAPVVVARCDSLNGRPAADITWVTAANGNASTTTQTAADNTVTVNSVYKLAPTPADNGKDISCVVAHRTQDRPESFSMQLAVEYPPQVSVVGYDNNWYVGRTNVVLTCEASGNPIPTTVTWKSLTGQMPDTVLIEENKLKVLKVDDSVNGTFVCEVQNRLGVGKDQITTVVREPSVSSSSAGVVAGAVIGSLLALLLVAALVAVLVTRSRRQQQGYRGNNNGGGAGGAGGNAFDIKSRVFGGGKKASKNGTGGGAGGAGGNNNEPIYVYGEDPAHLGLGEKANHLGGRLEVAATTPSAQDILLSGELDEAERRKFDELEEDERYDRFTGPAPILQLRPPSDEVNAMIGGYLDDDMESQRDGSVISRTAVYV